MSRSIIPSIRSNDFEETIAKYERVIVDFYSDFCAPCSALSSALEELIPEYPESYYFKIDIEEASELADDMDVQAIPCLMFFNDGKIKKQVIGYLGPEKLENDIRSFLGYETNDLSDTFADGELWDLDDSDAVDMIQNVRLSVLYFIGSEKTGSGSLKRNLKMLANEFEGMIFFGMLESVDSPATRNRLRIPRKQHVILFLQDGLPKSRLIGKAGMRELRTEIARLLSQKYQES
ncbi:MAG: thioredoxin family protein [Candidatus Thorarchaeota archaeon]|nr:thioredoxin family protein [Candidatus Thorarchaeota archaeon]